MKNKLLFMKRKTIKLISAIFQTIKEKDIQNDVEINGKTNKKNIPNHEGKRYSK
jgi:hypothetical protein